MTNLISRKTSKKLKKKQHIQSPKCIDITKRPLYGKCQYLVYKVDVYSNKSCDKRVYVGSTQGPFKKKKKIL